MTVVGRLRQRRRPILFAGLLLSAIWAAWWLWPPHQPGVDFSFRTDPMAQMIFYDLIADKPMELPTYKDGGFHSAQNARIAPRDVIRYDPGVPNKTGPFYTAMFRMAPGTTRGDFTHAVRDIWSVCDADVAAAAHGEEETFLILPESYSRDCTKALGVPAGEKSKPPAAAR